MRYPVGMSSEWLARLSPADRLRLLAFDCELRRLLRPLISALWEALDALEYRSAMGGESGSIGSGPSGSQPMTTASSASAKEGLRRFIPPK
jgi:hypothetical protein